MTDAGTPVARVLTRHFFGSLFDFGFLSDAGAESFKRLLMGIAAVGLALGLLLLRAFAAKYIGLAEGPLDEYQRNLLADHAFLIALPMWLSAVTVVLVGHSLFPDETDFRILMAQPVTRATVFGAKLTALCLFVVIVAGTAHVALAPLIGLTLASQKAGGPLVWRFLAYAMSSAAASACTVLAIVAIHGLVVLVAPRSRLIMAGTLVRSVLLGTLGLAVPLVARLPAIGGAFVREATWLAWVPPAWFVAVERTLVGDGRHSALAAIAVIAAIVSLVASAASYAVLYRRFDRVTARPASTVRARRQRVRRSWLRAPRPVRLAVASFTAVTLRRSVLHQGIVIALTAGAAGFVVNNLYVQLTSRLDRRGAIDDLTWSLVWAPFALMLVSSVAVRLALTVPIELRANWIFRMTEDPATRADAVGAAVWTVFKLGVALPVLLAAPVQAIVLGSRVWVAVGIELSAGWLLSELLMGHWRRLPFTCAYIPGKGFVPQMFVRGLFAFTAFTTLGAAFVYVSLVEPAFRPVAATLTGVPAAVLLVRRRRASRITPLAFEDELPSEVHPLRLQGD